MTYVVTYRSHALDRSLHVEGGTRDERSVVAPRSGVTRVASQVDSTDHARHSTEDAPCLEQARYVGPVANSLPIFPLSSVVFPGVSISLHIFEDRYRDLVRHLLDKPERERTFGIVAIREGYEVGDSGMQSAHRVGCEVQVTGVETYDDGRYDIDVVARRRLRLNAMVSTDSFMWAQVDYLPEVDGTQADEAATRAHAVFEAYRGELRSHHLDSTVTDLPHEPTPLSYTLSATAVLTVRDQQGLLEAPDAATRLRQFSRLLVAEISAMRAIPSLPAVEVARASWSPN